MVGAFVSLILLLPGSIPRDLVMLRYISFIGMVATLFALGFLVVSAVQTNDAWQENLEPFFYGPADIHHAFMIYPIIFSGVCIHFNAPKFFDELRPKHKTPKRWFWLVMFSFVVAATIMCAYGASGQACWGMAAEQVIFLNFGEVANPTTFSKVMLIVLAVNVICGYPLNFNASRRAFFDLSRYFHAPWGETRLARIVVTIIGVGIIVFVCYWNPKIGDVNEVKGFTVATALSGYFPVIIYLIAHSRKNTNSQASLQNPKNVLGQHMWDIESKNDSDEDYVLMDDEMVPLSSLSKRNTKQSYQSARSTARSSRVTKSDVRNTNVADHEVVIQSTENITSDDSNSPKDPLTRENTENNRKSTSRASTAPSDSSSVFSRVSSWWSHKTGYEKMILLLAWFLLLMSLFITGAGIYQMTVGSSAPIPHNVTVASSATTTSTTPRATFFAPSPTNQPR